LFLLAKFLSDDNITEKRRSVKPKKNGTSLPAWQTIRPSHKLCRKDDWFNSGLEDDPRFLVRIQAPRKNIPDFFALYRSSFRSEEYSQFGILSCALQTANLFLDAPLPFLITTIIAIAIIVVISENSEAQEID